MSFGNKVLGFGAFPTRGDYEIDQSLMFEATETTWLSHQPSSAGNRQTWTWSAWVKRTKETASSNRQYIWCVDDGTNYTVSNFFAIYFNDSQQLEIRSGGTVLRATTRVFRDFGAWMHVVVQTDVTQSSASERLKIYVNGVQETSFGTSNDPAEDTDLAISNTIYHYYGRSPDDDSSNPDYYSLDAYLAEVNFTDGVSNAASEFGKTNALTDQWIPIRYTGSYGSTTGYYLKFVSGAIGTDYSGLGNNYGTGNLDNTNVHTDTPTNNFPTVNYAEPWNTTISTLAEGNLNIKAAAYDSGNYGNHYITFLLPTSGKWYIEMLTGIQAGSGNRAQLGISSKDPAVGGVIPGQSNQWSTFSSSTALDISIYANTADLYDGGSSIDQDTGLTATSYVCALAIDVDNGKVYAGYDSGSAITWLNSGNPATGSNGAAHTFTMDSAVYTSVATSSDNANRSYVIMNFGQNGTFAGYKTAGGNADGNGEGNFFYSPPSGYLAMCSKNLPTPTIALPGDHFNALLYTGNDTDDRALTGVGFQPDLVWIKCRSINANHGVSDSQRVDSGTYKIIYPDANNAESTSGTYISAISSDGFSLANSGSDNQNNETYVAWSWKANGSGSTNDDGATDSTVSVNTTAGFSIVTFTMPSSGSTTFGHGLGAVPDYIIAKGTGASGNWSVWVKPPMDSTDDYMQLNTNAAQGSYSTVWGAAVPTSSVFGATVGGLVPASTTGVAYCFAEVEGYSKCGSFTGNGTVDGPFIYTGFRPAFTMIKRTDSTANWFMYDNKRDTFNPVNEGLFADIVNSETTQTNGMIDYVSNGFKIRNTGTAMNASSGTFSYIAFAKSPFKYANAR